MAPETREALVLGANVVLTTFKDIDNDAMSEQDAQEALRMLRALIQYLSTSGEPDANATTGHADQPAGPCDGQAPDAGGGWYGIYDDTFFLT